MTKDLEFRNGKGQMIRGRMWLPEGAGEDGRRYPLAVFAHGFGSNYRELMHHGQGFADRDICCFMFDFCGGGPESLSDGDMMEMSVVTECADMECVLREMAELPYIDENAIFLMGESQGGLVAALTGAKYPEKVRGLILWYPGLGIPDKARRFFPDGVPDTKSCGELYGKEVGRAYYADVYDMDPYAMIGAFRGPVQIIHGDCDEIVPLFISERAMGLYKNASLLVLKGAGHGFEFPDNQTARETSIEFILKNIA